MKKLISLILTVVMMTMTISQAVVSVSAESTMSDYDLYLNHPEYLSNREMEEGIENAEKACYAVMNSYSDADEKVALFMSEITTGIAADIRDVFNKIGIADSTYETYVKKSAEKLLRNTIADPTSFKKVAEDVGKVYDKVKMSYDIASSVDKTEIRDVLVAMARENDTYVDAITMNKMVDELYESVDLSHYVEVVGDVSQIWIYVMEITELYCIESGIIEELMAELEQSNLQDSDLYHGLSLIQRDRQQNVGAYVTKNFVTEKIIEFIADNVVGLLSVVVGAPVAMVQLAVAVCKLFAESVYVNAKAEDIAQAMMQYAFISAIETCMSRYTGKFNRREATTLDVDCYERLYGVYLAALITYLETCQDVSKIEDKFGIGGDCGLWADNMRYTYTYQQYMKWCKAALARDIEKGDVDGGTGSSTITDDLNEATIKERMEKVMAYSKYVPNVDQRWVDTGGSLSFAALVFNRIFGRDFVERVNNMYKHTLTNTRNLREIGTLDEEEVTNESVTQLLSQARIGDLIFTSGKEKYLHVMVVCSVEEDRVEVYDCGSPFVPKDYEDQQPDIIRKYKVKFSRLVSACCENGEYMTVPGITVYRAVKKINSSSIGGDEDDDSKNYVIEDGVLVEYKGKRTEIEIPEGVTKIGEKCFYGKSIRTVTMPNTVTEILYDAFRDCSSLEYVKFSSNLKKIDSRAFCGCSRLYNIFLPQGITHINAHAFRASGLISLNIPDSLTKIDWYAFAECMNLRTVTMGKNLNIMGTDVFKECLNLKTVYWNATKDGIFGSGDYDVDSTLGRDVGKNAGGFDLIIGEGVTVIPAKAFRYSEYLKSIYMPDSLTKIGKQAFIGCDMITSVTIPENVLYVGVDAFSFSENLKTIQWNARAVSNVYSSYETPFAYGYNEDLPAVKVVFGESVESIPTALLSDTECVKEIVIGSNVKKIGDYAFERTGISEIVFPDSVEECGFGALNSCEALTDITFSANMNEYDCEILFNLPSLMNMYVSPDSIYLETDDNVLYDKGKTTVIAVPEGRETVTIDKNCKKISMNIEDRQFKNKKEILVESNNSYLTSVDGSLYRKNKSAIVRYAAGKTDTEFTLPAGITAIEDSAFAYSSNLEKVNIPESVTSIGSYAFSMCEKLKDVNLPNGLAEISQGIFQRNAITEITIPEGVNTIQRYAFYNCNNLTTVRIPKSMLTIENNAFENCENITDVYYGAGPRKWKEIYISDNNESLTNAKIRYAVDFDEETVPGLLRYEFDPDVWLEYSNSANVTHINVGEKTYLKGYSNNYQGKYILADVQSGEIVFDNLSSVGKLSEYTSLIYLVTNDKAVIYDLDKNEEICEIIDAGQFKYTSRFSEEGGFVTLASDGKIYFISKDGVIGNAINIDYSSYTYDNMGPKIQTYLGGGLWWLVVGNSETYTKSIGAVNADGEIVAYFDSLSNYSPDGLIVVRANGKYGAIDRNGQFVIPCEYTEITEHREGEITYLGVKDGFYYLIDKNGDLILTFTPDAAVCDGVYNYIGDGLFLVYQNDKNERYRRYYGVANNNGEVIIPAKYASIYIMASGDEDIHLLCLTSAETYNQSYGAIDSNGNIVIPFEYSNIGGFREGLARTLKDGKYGFLNKQGEVAIPFVYDWAYNFSEGLVGVSKDGYYGFIDKEGKTVIPFEYLGVSEFYNGMAWVYKDSYDEGFYINKENQVVTDYEVGSGEETVSGKYSLTKQYNWDQWNNASYDGGIRNNITGQVFDIAHLNLLPCIVGSDNQYILGFTPDLEKAYRIIPEELGGEPGNSNVEITAFTAANYGTNAYINLSIVNAPSDAVVYVVSYDTLGKLLEVQNLTLNNGVAGAIFSTSSVYKYKAFIWKGDTIRPLSDPKECKLQ